jgi:hypothetical protein
MPARCAWAQALAQLPLSAGSGARRCRRRGDRDCFALASLAFRWRPVGRWALATVPAKPGLVQVVTTGSGHDVGGLALAALFETRAGAFEMLVASIEQVAFSVSRRRAAQRAYEIPTIAPSGDCCLATV